VKWSPDGKKFAVASGAKVVPVCHYESQNDWWISKMIKKHKSTVLSVAWHPNSQLVATACSDFRARVFSAFIPEVDGGGAKSIICGETNKTGFGDLLAEFAGSNGWVEGIAWSPNGNILAYVGHDASLSFAVWDEKHPTAEPTQETFKEQGFPSTCVLFLSDSVVVTAGHEFRPFVYQHPGPNRGTWKFLGSPDKEPPKAKEEPKAGEKSGETGFAASKTLWSNKTTKAQDGAASAQDSAELWTKHSNTILDIKPFGDTQWSTKLEAFSTAGLDGKIIVWESKDFKANVPGLNL
jgi:actin related protein 2/3 complex subunit 1A/1B